MAITEADAELIATAVTRLRDRQRIEYQDQDPAIHRDHHAWISIQIERERRCKERREKIINTAIGSACLSIIAALAALGAYVLNLIRDDVLPK